MNILSRLYDFLFPLTADAMQARMLRDVMAQWRGRRAWIEVTRMYPKMCREFGVDPSVIVNFGNRSFSTQFTSDDFSRTGADWARENAEYERNFKRVMEEFK